MLGLDLLLDLPHPIWRYYEPELRYCEVKYDSQGWPVHPYRSYERVRIINESSELCMNLIFFFAFPGLLVWLGIKAFWHWCHGMNDFNCMNNDQTDHKHYETCESNYVNMNNQSPYEMCSPNNSSPRVSIGEYFT